MPPKAKKESKPEKSEDKKGGKAKSEDKKKVGDKAEDAEKTQLLMESGLLEAYECISYLKRCHKIPL